MKQRDIETTNLGGKAHTNPKSFVYLILTLKIFYGMLPNVNKIMCMEMYKVIAFTNSTL